MYCFFNLVAANFSNIAIQDVVSELSKNLLLDSAVEMLCKSVLESAINEITLENETALDETFVQDNFDSTVDFLCKSVLESAIGEITPFEQVEHDSTDDFINSVSTSEIILEDEKETFEQVEPDSTDDFINSVSTSEIILEDENERVKPDSTDDSINSVSTSEINLKKEAALDDEELEEEFDALDFMDSYDYDPISPNSEQLQVQVESQVNPIDIIDSPPTQKLRRLNSQSHMKTLQNTLDDILAFTINLKLAEDALKEEKIVVDMVAPQESIHEIAEVPEVIVSKEEPELIANNVQEIQSQVTTDKSTPSSTMGDLMNIELEASLSKLELDFLELINLEDEIKMSDSSSLYSKRSSFSHSNSISSSYILPQSRSGTKALKMLGILESQDPEIPEQHEIHSFVQKREASIPKALKTLGVIPSNSLLIKQNSINDDDDEQIRKVSTKALKTLGIISTSLPTLAPPVINQSPFRAHDQVLKDQDLNDQDDSDEELLQPIRVPNSKAIKLLGLSSNDPEKNTNIVDIGFGVDISLETMLKAETKVIRKGSINASLESFEYRPSDDFSTSQPTPKALKMLGIVQNSASKASDDESIEMNNRNSKALKMLGIVKKGPTKVYRKLAKSQFNSDGEAEENIPRVNKAMKLLGVNDEDVPLIKVSRSLTNNIRSFNASKLSAGSSQALNSEIDVPRVNKAMKLLGVNDDEIPLVEASRSKVAYDSDDEVIIRPNKALKLLGVDPDARIQGKNGNSPKNKEHETRQKELNNQALRALHMVSSSLGAESTGNGKVDKSKQPPPSTSFSSETTSIESIHETPKRDSKRQSTATPKTSSITSSLSTQFQNSLIEKTIRDINSESILSGYLSQYVSSGFVKWKIRFFILSYAALYYFKANNLDEVAIGSFSVDVKTNISIAPGFKGKFVIELKNVNEVLFLMCEDEEEMVNWVRGFKAVVVRDTFMHRSLPATPSTHPARVLFADFSPVRIKTDGIKNQPLMTSPVMMTPTNTGILTPPATVSLTGSIGFSDSRAKTRLFSGDDDWLIGTVFDKTSVDDLLSEMDSLRN